MEDLGGISLINKKKTNTNITPEDKVVRSVRKKNATTSNKPNTIKNKTKKRRTT